MSDIEIENKGIEDLFGDEQPKKKVRGRASKAKPVSPAQSLIDAITFISNAQKKAGEPNQTHCAMSGGWVCAFDGVLTIGAKIEEAIHAAPNTFKFLAALKQVENDISITQLSQNSLAVTSGDFRAIVPCVELGEISCKIAGPDAPCAAISDDLALALGDVMPLATEGAATALFGGILMQANTVVATNGHVIFESWHGIDLPPGLVIPKAAAKAITKAKKKLVSFGYSASSATFYFDDESFIKTQLFNFRYPEYAHTLTNDSGWSPLPEMFFDALKAVTPFVEGNKVYFKNGMIVTDYREDVASTYHIENLPEGLIFNHKYLMLIKPLAKQVAFVEEPAKMMFFGDRTRGAIMGLSKGSEVKSADENLDDDVPF